MTEKEIFALPTGTPIRVKAGVDCHESFKTCPGALVFQSQTTDEHEYSFGINAISADNIDSNCFQFSASDFELVTPKLSFSSIKWVIMSTDRKLIAKGNPRNRRLILVDDIKDNKRILFYDSQKRAEAAYRDSGFYIGDTRDSDKYEKYNGLEFKDFLVAVAVNVTITENN